MKRVLVIIGILAIALSACATRALRSESPAAPPVPGVQAFGAGGGDTGSANDFANANKAAGAVPPSAPQVAQPQPQAAPRMVIQNADLTVVVADVNSRINAIQSMAKSMGGFVVSVQVSQVNVLNGEPVPQATITIRVPQEKLDEALTQIKQGVIDVPSENRSGNDVTDQYVDLQSRLKAKEAAEQQLLTIMQEAKRTEDVLAVYSQLQQIQSDIEVLKGQIKYYEQSAALSAISVNVVAEQSVQPIQVGSWKPQGVARDAIQQLIYFWQGFANFLINFFLFILPVLITIAIPLFLLFLLVRWLIRKTRKPKAVAVVEGPRQ